MKVEVAVVGSPSLIVLNMVSVPFEEEEKVAPDQSSYDVLRAMIGLNRPMLLKGVNGKDDTQSSGAAS